VAKRDETTTALQALSLMNNPFIEAMSAKLASRTSSSEGMLRVALGRSPSEQERDVLNHYLEAHGAPALARLIFNLNEFTYVD
ncbi:MAG: DUF1553 domain-containing protein, partial [Verrucomicrobiota bacterium]